MTITTARGSSPLAGALRWVVSWLIVSVITVAATLYVVALTTPPEEEPTDTGQAVVESATSSTVPRHCVAAEHLVGGFAPTVSELGPTQEAAIAAAVEAAAGADCVSGEAERVCAGGVVASVVGHADADPSGRVGGNQALSEARAQAVARAMTARGVVVVHHEGRAANDPAPGPEPDDRTRSEQLADDRRVVIEFHCAHRGGPGEPPPGILDGVGS